MTNAQLQGTKLVPLFSNELLMHMNYPSVCFVRMFQQNFVSCSSKHALTKRALRMVCIYAILCSGYIFQGEKFSRISQISSHL